MIIRAQLGGDKTVLDVYSNVKGDKSPLASVTIDQPIEQITAVEMNEAVTGLREAAVEKYSRRAGLRRYTTNGGA